MKRLYLLISILTCSIIGSAQITTQPLHAVLDVSAGLLYSLPKTVLVIKVETRKIHDTPGIYFPYAERYLGVTNICQAESIRYEIVGIRISTKAVPDLQKAYVITTGKAKSAPAIELTSEGFLKSIGKTDGKKECLKNSTENMAKPSCPEKYQSQETSIVTKEMQQATSTAKMAELAAAQLFNLRDTRINLLTMDLDKTPSDGRSYEIVLGELNRMENYYRELFTGKHTESTETSTFEYEPQKKEEEILFRFSQLKGIVDKTDLGGNPVFIDLQKILGSMADIAIPSADNSKIGYSIYYRIPGKAQVKITNGNTILCDQKITVAQFGQVMNLPAGAVSSAEFCPMTGAIMRLEK
ncbi:MAG: DUF4831 family protein [Bacteroidales bacterium]|nr:DUF4831 family protein [Bacteroidales bacterium]